jgi:hypothetical protein
MKTSLKSRLAIPDLNVEFDDLLTTALTSLSARFDRETNRTLTRTANTTHEFDACETEIIPSCYPIESVSKFLDRNSQIRSHKPMEKGHHAKINRAGCRAQSLSHLYC